MSIEYFLYSFDDRPVTISELQAILSSDGWEVVVVRNFKRWSAFELALGGGLMDWDLACAWKKQSGRGGKIMAALDSKNEQAISRFHGIGEFASCLVYASVPYEAVKHLEDEETLKELREGFGQDYIDARIRAKARYGTRTSSGRSDADYQLQTDVTKALCHLRGGLFENQTDTAFPSTRSRKRAGRGLVSV